MCSRTLSNLLWTGNYDDMVGSALHHTFKQTENGWCAGAKKAKDTAGSCSTVVVVKGTKVRGVVFHQTAGNPIAYWL